MKYSDRIINHKITLVVVLLLLTGCHSVSFDTTEQQQPATLQKADYSWRQTDTSLALLNHGQVVWQSNYERQGKPCFHPIALTDSTELTWLCPPDHPWHRGLWFSWKYINGLNYWEEDHKTGLSQGRTEVVAVKALPARDYSARIEMTLSYHPPDEPAVLTEKRLIVISAPDKNGLYRIDWYSIFTAGDKDVLLNRTPIKGEKGGVNWGGYAGLSVRLAKTIGNWKVIDSQDTKGLQVHGKKARWMDFSGETAAGKAAGIAIFDNPDNPRHPSPWFVIMNEKVPFGYFSPAILLNEPYTLPAGKKLTLRYHILIHPGRGDRKMLENEWKILSALKAQTKEPGRTK